MLTVNEHPWPWRTGLRLGELAVQVKPGADILLLGGARADPATLVQDGDFCTVIKRGELPTGREIDRVLEARHGREHQALLRRATVGILGLGGLGSALACCLAKIGVGKLILADYDVVTLSNLHRQHYFLDQVGHRKTEALAASLMRINPYLDVRLLDRRLTEEDIPRLFPAADVLAECFDDPAMKAAALRATLLHLPRTAYVGASGLAGTGCGETIISRPLRPGVYLVGDGSSEAGADGGLWAPRVGIAAHQQANQILRLLLGQDEGRVKGEG
ncbi:MAG: thiamine biosynthesis protein ThiF [Desulfobulbaceae bacterium A2]|nr:MAG: thiamine biosynthesis protein ThiF [Desulfobulbaceae bacterium A2]